MCDNLKKPEVKCKHCDSHHTTPQAFGGIDGASNEVTRPSGEHNAYHTMNAHFPPDIIVEAVLFKWETYNPYLQAKKDHVKESRLHNRFKAWEMVYGSDATRFTVVKKIVEHYTLHPEDKSSIKEILPRALSHEKLTEEEFKELVSMLSEQ